MRTWVFIVAAGFIVFGIFIGFADPSADLPLLLKLGFKEDSYASGLQIQAVIAFFLILLGVGLLLTSLLRDRGSS